MSDLDADDGPELLPQQTFVGRLKARLRRVADWRRDDLLRRLYRNASLLGLGEGAAALLGLGALALTTRGLGLFEWGVLATVIAYTHLVGGLLKFQTWQAVVKFGADALQRGDQDGLRRLIRLTTSLDIATALLAAVVCLVTMPLFMALAKLDVRYQQFALVYSAAALLTISATPVGILRLFDRFDLLAMIPPISAGLRLLGCAVAWQQGGGLWSFGMVWLGSALADRMLHVVLGWYELYRRNHLRGILGGYRGIAAGHDGLWRFVVAGNLQSSLNALTKEIDTLLVVQLVAWQVGLQAGHEQGAQAGAIAGGIWVLAKRFSTILSGPARLFLVSIFPQLARLWATHDYRRFRRLILRSSLLGGGGGLLAAGLFGLVGDWLIGIIAGAQFTGAYWPTLLLMLSRVVTLFAMPLNPALLAMNRPMKSLKIALVVWIVYLPVLVVTTVLWGPAGTGMGRIVAEIMPFGWLTMAVMRTVRRHIVRADRLRAAAAQ